MSKDKWPSWQILVTICWWLSAPLSLTTFGIISLIPEDGPLGHDVVLVVALLYALLLGTAIWFVSTAVMVYRHMIAPTRSNKFMLATAGLLLVTPATLLYYATR